MKRPFAHRTAHTAEGTMIATALPAASHLVRLFPIGNDQYDRMIVVSEEDDGETLFLSGWIGPPLTPAQWREAKAALFPKAKAVAWERRGADGQMRPAGYRSIQDGMGTHLTGPPERRKDSAC